MMAPERLNILRTAFQTAKLLGLHDNITLAPKTFSRKLCQSMNILPPKNGL